MNAVLQRALPRTSARGLPSLSWQGLPTCCVPCSLTREASCEVREYTAGVCSPHQDTGGKPLADFHGKAFCKTAFIWKQLAVFHAALVTLKAASQRWQGCAEHKQKEKEKCTPFSDHNRSLLRRQPGAMTISHSPKQNTSSL